MCHHLAIVRERIGGWLSIRIRLRRPATDVRGVVLIPVDPLRGWDEGDVVDHDLLDLVHDLDLLRLARPRVLIEEGVGGR